MYKNKRNYSICKHYIDIDFYVSTLHWRKYEQINAGEFGKRSKTRQCIAFAHCKLHLFRLCSWTFL